MTDSDHAAPDTREGFLATVREHFAGLQEEPKAIPRNSASYHALTQLIDYMAKATEDRDVVYAGGTYVGLCHQLIDSKVPAGRKEAARHRLHHVGDALDAHKAALPDYRPTAEESTRRIADCIHIHSGAMARQLEEINREIKTVTGAFQRQQPDYGRSIVATLRHMDHILSGFSELMVGEAPEKTKPERGVEISTQNRLSHSVAAEAEAILLSVVHTVYQHEAYVDVATGTYDMDCSGYVGYVLQRIAPLHYQTIPSDNAADRPLAFDFYDLFSGLPQGGANGWRPVQSLGDARRGDIVAWRSELLEPRENTGHVLIVAAEPEIVGDGVISILAYDSSNIRHYDDTRGQGGNSPATGLGSGRIHFRHGDSGWEFQFGPGESYHDCPIAVGQIQPLSAAVPYSPSRQSVADVTATYGENAEVGGVR
jgi:hypothetical protein